jgi:hypothetical protein
MLRKRDSTIANADLDDGDMLTIAPARHVGTAIQSSRTARTCGSYAEIAPQRQGSATAKLQYQANKVSVCLGQPHG